MSYLTDDRAGTQHLFMGNEAIARGALEAGVSVATGYPGTPSSEIIEGLAGVSGERHLYVEWSANEKLALEVAAAASFAGLRSLCVMKQNGVNVASDFLLHLAGPGTRGGIVLVPCDDPGALSSANEGESRHFARLVEIPLLEPGDFQEAKDMIKWAFELSEEIRNVVMVRSVTRLSHASGNVVLGALPETKSAHAFFKHGANILDSLEGAVVSLPVIPKHALQQEKLKKAVVLFEESVFNRYTGPESPELLLITSSACNLYSREAIHLLGLEERVGLLKLGTTWPLPPALLERHMARTDRILVVEEVIPFLEENVKILGAELAPRIGIKTFYGKRDGSLPATGELNPDLVMTALEQILEISTQDGIVGYPSKTRDRAYVETPGRELTFCPGCPHRASFWTIHKVLEMDNRQGFVCGDIGCYSMALLPTGFSTVKVMHSMGSGMGVASGFGKLGMFGMDQPVLAVSGDSTFFHAVLPALVNAAHHKSDITLVVLDNRGTAMTGFQPHPGLGINAMGDDVPGIDIAAVCEAMGARVEIRDPFDLEETERTLKKLLEDKRGLKVLILRQACALSPERKHRMPYRMRIDQERCLGEDCGCNRLCTRIFLCPGLYWDKEKRKAGIDEVLCVGCGICSTICPNSAIEKKEVA